MEVRGGEVVMICGTCMEIRRDCERESDETRVEEFPLRNSRISPPAKCQILIRRLSKRSETHLQHLSRLQSIYPTTSREREER